MEREKAEAARMAAVEEKAAAPLVSRLFTSSSGTERPNSVSEICNICNIWTNPNRKDMDPKHDHYTTGQMTLVNLITVSSMPKYSAANLNSRVKC